RRPSPCCIQAALCQPITGAAANGQPAGRSPPPLAPSGLAPLRRRPESCRVAPAAFLFVPIYELRQMRVVMLTIARRQGLIPDEKGEDVAGWPGRTPANSWLTVSVPIAELSQWCVGPRRRGDRHGADRGCGKGNRVGGDASVALDVTRLTSARIGRLSRECARSLHQP